MLETTKHIALILLFIASILVMTYPLAFGMRDHIPGFEETNEPYSILWDMWWFKYSHRPGLSYNNCNFLALPFGLDLSRPAGSSYLWEGIKRGLVMLTDEVLAYNILIVSGFALTLVLTYILMVRMTGSKGASFLSALLFSYCPYHFARTWQHLSLAQIQWIPLYCLALFMLWERPSKTKTLFLAASLFVVAAVNFYYAYFMIVVTGVFFVYCAVRTKKIRPVLTLMLHVTMAYVIVLLLLSPALYDVYLSQKLFSGTPSGYGLTQRPFADLFTQSAKPLSYLLPAIQHPVFGRFTERFIGSPLYGVSYTEHALYLGWTAIILAFVAVRRRTDSAGIREKSNFYIGFFMWLAVIAWLFSQPPYFTFPHFKIYMPSFVMYKILPMFRAYCRFGLLVMFAVSVLAGYGLQAVLARCTKGVARAILTCIIIALALFEFLNFPPFRVINLKAYPPVYQWLREQKGDFIIAEYPLDTEGPHELYKFYQTIHGKRMINGTLPGTYANRLAQGMRRLSDPRTTRILGRIKVKYVLAHLDSYEESNDIEMLDERSRLSTRSIEGLKFNRSLDRVDIYEVTPEPIKQN